MSALGDLIGPAMKRRGLLQTQLAREVGLTKAMLSHILAGTCRLQTDVAIRLAAALELDARELMAAAPLPLLTRAQLRKRRLGIR